MSNKTKRDPSYWEYVDAFDSMKNSNSSVRRSASSFEHPDPRTIMAMLDQFQSFIHDFIHNIVDVKTDGNYGYRLVAGLLGMGEDSWSLVRTHLLKELGKFSYKYMKLFGGKERFEELRMSLLVDGLTKFDVYICFIQVTMDKWMDITDMGYVIASRYNVILVSLSQQQSMTFFPLRSQSSLDSSVHRIICIEHVYLTDRCPLPSIALLWSSNCHPPAKQRPTLYISRMQHYKSFMMFKRHYVDINDDLPIRVPNGCDFQTIHNTLQLTDKQYLDEIYYRQPFIDIGNHLRFQCMQLKNDDDVNTMLMCNHQFSCVGPIELLCTIGRTPDDILNLLKTTMTLTHDALLYYNRRWNMPCQNEFFDIPSGCTMDELKDLIKQVAPHGIPPYGIHEKQTVRRLFF
ncbi:hypothetical protein HKD37_11G031532 [Glycine soja]